MPKSFAQQLNEFGWTDFVSFFEGKPFPTAKVMRFDS
jgi:hypothetical protein